MEPSRLNLISMFFSMSLALALLGMPLMLAAHGDDGDATARLTVAVPEVDRPADAHDATMAHTIVDSVAQFAARYGIPVSLARVIYEQAGASEVEPALLFGLIAIESAFNPHAVGPAGAVGLMQIKPSTARIYQSDVTIVDLKRPETNLRLGLKHLVREVRHFRSWKLGLLAYNMGRTGLSRALAGGRVPRTGYAMRVLAHCGSLCS